MTTLVTGAAGFIGSHVAAALLERGEPVIGLDNVNAYYDPDLKRARLARLQKLTPRGLSETSSHGRSLLFVISRGAGPGPAPGPDSGWAWTTNG